MSRYAIEMEVVRTPLVRDKVFRDMDTRILKQPNPRSGLYCLGSYMYEMSRFWKRQSQKTVRSQKRTESLAGNIHKKGGNR